jgi:predicted RNA-binding protein (virulence factor B family)
VSKAKGQILNASVNFFKAGIDVCLTQDNYLGTIPEKEKKKKIFRGPRVWATTIVRPSVGENGSAPFSVKLLSRAL